MVALSHGTLYQSILAAYERLTRDQLVLFLSLRALPLAGTDNELARRLADDELARHLPAQRPVNTPSLLPLAPPAESSTLTLSTHAHPRSVSQLPLEIIADIVDHVADWELAKALRLPTSLPRPAEWDPALARVSPTDRAILAAPLSVVRAVSACDPRGPTKRGTHLAVRFARVDVLDHLLAHARPALERDFGPRLEQLPTLASVFGRTDVLEFWRTAPHGPLAYTHEAIDGACRSGFVHVLDWWRASGLRMEYSDAALEHASAGGHIPVLEWFQRSGLPLKIGRVVDTASSAGCVAALEWWLRSGLEFKYDKLVLAHASMHGRLNVLRWWSRSGLQMLFDQDALTGATRLNRREILEWWAESGLPIQYRICDIEEALEDAIGDAAAVRQWWASKGVDFHANDAEWLKLQPLNPHTSSG